MLNMICYIRKFPAFYDTLSFEELLRNKTCHIPLIIFIEYLLSQN